MDFRICMILYTEYISVWFLLSNSNGKYIFGLNTDVVKTTKISVNFVVLPGSSTLYTIRTRWLFVIWMMTHQMETSALLAMCAANSPVPGEFPTQRPVTRTFDVFFDLRLNKRLSKQCRGWWFETLSCPLWRNRNVVLLFLSGTYIYRNPCFYQDKTFRAKSFVKWTLGLSVATNEYMPHWIENVYEKNQNWCGIRFMICTNAIMCRYILLACSYTDVSWIKIIDPLSPYAYN